jgi:phosphatidylglycerophosphate synthase
MTNGRDAASVAAWPQSRRSASILAPLDHRLSAWLAGLVPDAVRGYHLTLCTLLWSGLLVCSGWWAKTNARFLFCCAALVLLQYLTDAVDGKVGQLRGEGLASWGYYTDHSLDYVFTCCVFISYSFIVLPENQYLITCASMVAGGFMVNAYLKHGATSRLELNVGPVGPVEIRLVFAGVYILAWFRAHALLAAVPVSICVAAGVLAIQIHRNASFLWQRDAARGRPEADVPDAVGGP